MANHIWIGLACLLGMTVPGNTEILWGANGHPFTAYPGISIERQLDYVEDIGLKSYRVNVPDAGRAPELKALVEAAKSRGITILPVITPVSAATLDKLGTEELYRDARDLAATLGAEFKDDIPVWELGNEMENYAIIKPCETRDDGTKYPCEWGPASGDNALDYYGPRWAKVSAILKGLSDGLTSVDPKLRKAMGTAGWGHVAAFERMQKDGIKWDISVWHTYGQDPEWAFKIISGYGHPIWVTEFNHPYGGQNGEDAQADGLQKMMIRLKALQGKYDVEAAHIYELLDESYWQPGYEAYMGLVRLTADGSGGWRTGEPKPAYFRVRDVVQGPRPLPKLTRDCNLEKGGTEASVALKISYVYCLVLGREPDADGLASWTAALKQEESGVPDMILSTLFSDEFTRRYRTFGLSDSAFVSFMYQSLLGRDADPGGLASYVRELHSGAMTRRSIAYGMMTSGEFRSKHPLLFSTEGAGNTASTSPG